MAFEIFCCFHHLFQARQQVRIEFEAQDYYPIELRRHGVDVGHLVAQALGVVGRIGRGVDNLAAALLRGKRQREERYQQQSFHYFLPISTPLVDTAYLASMYRVSQPGNDAGEVMYSKKR